MYPPCRHAVRGNIRLWSRKGPIDPKAFKRAGNRPPKSVVLYCSIAGSTESRDGSSTKGITVEYRLGGGPPGSRLNCWYSTSGPDKPPATFPSMRLEGNGFPFF